MDRNPRRGRLFQGEAEAPERRRFEIQETVLQEDPTVYDIGLAREAQRLRHRAVFRPAGLQRRAKVLRFRTETPLQFEMLLPEIRAKQIRMGLPGLPDGSNDLPPAA